MDDKDKDKDNQSTDVYRGRMTQCPSCGVDADSYFYQGPDSRPPTPGDLAICIECGEVNMYEVGGTLVRAPDHYEENLNKEQRDMLRLLKARIKSIQ